MPLHFRYSSLIDQYFGGVFSSELKCVESEDEPVTRSTEKFLQLSCFISQDVKYLHTGLKLVSGTVVKRMNAVWTDRYSFFVVDGGWESAMSWWSIFISCRIMSG